MYLIAAECETNVQTALDKYFLTRCVLVVMCVNQNASSAEELKSLIRAEYVREFIGEGQLFSIINGMLCLHIPDGGTVNSIKNISLDSYVFPLPDSETSQRAE